MEEFTASYTMTPALMRRMNRAARPWFEPLRWGLPVLYLLAWAVYRAWGWLALALFLTAWFEVTWRWSARPFLRGEHEVTLTFTEDGYAMATDAVSGSRAWTGYTKVVRRGDFWVLRISPIQAATFPMAALSPEQTTRLTDLLHRKGLLRSA